MSIIKRLTTTLVSRIDHVVGEIENHDALIQVSLGEIRKKVAEAKLRMDQLHREEERIKNQIEEENNKAQRWRQRARECAASDEAKALACLRRAQHCQARTEQLGHALSQYEGKTLTLARDIETSERRLAEMKQKHLLLRARQSASSALIATGETDDRTARLLDDSFERWEINLSQAELALNTHATADALEHEFITQEQQQALREELAALLTGEEKP